MKRFKAVLMLIAIVALILAGCEGPEPTVSPIATPQLTVVIMGQAPAQEEPLSAEIVAAVVAAVISILLEVVPGLAAVWGKVDPTYKRLTWLIGCLLVPMVVLGAGCIGLALGVVAPACDKQGIIMALKIAFVAYFAGQATFAVLGRAIRRRKRDRSFRR
jgi:hypothetical protein